LWGISDGLAGHLQPGGVDFGYLVLQPVAGQLVTVSAERVGLNNLGTGFDVIPMNARHQVRDGQVELIETFLEITPALVEHGAIAHRTGWADSISTALDKGIFFHWQLTHYRPFFCYTFFINCSTRLSPTL